jgi:hypothetical protein
MGERDRENGEEKEKKLEKQRVEAERNRKSNRMRDWLANRNLREDKGSDGNASEENASYGNASYDNANGVCLGNQDVVQNVGEIVASFALERLEEQQPGKVNDGWHTLEEGTLVSRDMEVLADEDRTKDKDKR